MSARFAHDAVMYGQVNSSRKMKNMFSVCVCLSSDNRADAYVPCIYCVTGSRCTGVYGAQAGEQNERSPANKGKK